MGKLRISVYPNPSTERAVIDIEDPMKRSFNFALYNINGKLIRQSNNIKSQRLVIEKGNMLPGMYIYSIRFEDGERVSGKLVVR